MNRDELEHAIRAACDVAEDEEIWVFGSQAILYDLQYRLQDFHLFEERELDRFAGLYFAPDPEQSALYNGTLKSLEVRKTREGPLGVERGAESGVLEPAAEKGHRPGREDEIASLSAIIRELNERFGANLSEKDRKSLEHLEAQLTRDAGLEASVKANTKDNVRLTFEQKVESHFDEMAESNFKLLKRIVDDRQFGAVLVDRLFERFWRVMGEGGS